MTLPALMSIREVAEYLRLSPDYFARHWREKVADGFPPPVETERRILWAPSHIAAWEAARCPRHLRRHLPAESAHAGAQAALEAKYGRAS